MTPIRASCRSSRGSAGWWTASRAIRDSSASLGAAMGSALGDWGWLMDVSSWSIASTLAEPQTRLKRASQRERPEARALGRATHLRRRWSAGRIAYLPAWRATRGTRLGPCDGLGKLGDPSERRRSPPSSCPAHRRSRHRRPNRIRRAATTPTLAPSTQEPSRTTVATTPTPIPDPARDRARAGGRLLVGDDRPVPRRTRRGVDRKEHQVQPRARGGHSAGSDTLDP